MQDSMDSYETVIKPRQKWKLIDIAELWKYRELFLIFVWRDLKVRYKNTLLGILWVIFQPLLVTFVFTIFFGKVAKISSENLPYLLFVFIGLIFWTFFSSAVTQASNSFIENENILKKVYFPKEILPLSSIVTGLVDLSINLIILVIFILYFEIIPATVTLIVITLGVSITFLTASGLGLLLSSLNVKYRDIRYILPFFIQIFLFLTPVIYPLSTLRDSLRIILLLNPLAGVIESTRSAIGGSSHLDYGILTVSLVSSIVIFLLGLIYFRTTERFFADII